MTIPERFKEISQFKKKITHCSLQKNYHQKKWIFLKNGTKFEVSAIFLK